MTAETADQAVQQERETGSQTRTQTPPAHEYDSSPVRIEPDLDFIRALRNHGGDTLKMCFQCGTCSGVCEISTDWRSFPARQMVWANWGMKDRLLCCPEVWLCHQCNDCTVRCPRGARPGEVLGAVRQEAVREYAMPRFLGRWVNQPHCFPLLIAIPTLLLTIALAVREPLASFLGLAEHAGEQIIYPYSSQLPHWLINSFFGFFSLLALLAVIVGVGRFWRAMSADIPPARAAAPVRGVWSSIWTTLKSIVSHDRFEMCTQARPRLLSHIMVFFGFIALTLVAIWVITARYNPLIRGDFVYPFAFWNPWKILANLAGVAVIAGCGVMIRDRIRDNEEGHRGSYFDFALIGTILAVAITGFGSELMHYLRLEPHRHIVYFVHLVFVFTLLIYLPYSKFAHMVYRTTAMVFAERFGLTAATPPAPADKSLNGRQEGEADG